MPVLENTPFQAWAHFAEGQWSGEEYVSTVSASMHKTAVGLIHGMGAYSDRYVLHNSTNGVSQIATRNDGQDMLDAEPTLIVTKLPKRRDFLHSVPKSNQDNEAYTKPMMLPASCCTVDKIPITSAMFALFLPSILHRFEIAMIAETLRTTVLCTVRIRDAGLIETAITHISAAEPTDYQRLEFLGDCVLKYSMSIHLSATHLTWPEGYLTAAKSQKVSNGSLARASLKAGLDQFIIAKPFTGAKWRPRYVQEMASSIADPTPVQRSSKIVADIVESLIGASIADGGLRRAETCLSVLLPEERWQFDQYAGILFDSAPTHDVHLELLEDLI
ncbi:hypothetical protein LTS18_001518, partial [Coniosporium uncinatum]